MLDKVTNMANAFNSCGRILNQTDGGFLNFFTYFDRENGYNVNDTYNIYIYPVDNVSNIQPYKYNANTMKNED